MQRNLPPQTSLSYEHFNPYIQLCISPQNSDLTNIDNGIALSGRLITDIKTFAKSLGIYASKSFTVGGANYIGTVPETSKYQWIYSCGIVFRRNTSVWILWIPSRAEVIAIGFYDISADSDIVWNIK